MKYFFILGSNPNVSTAEIMNLVQEAGFTLADFSPQVLIIEGDRELNTQELMTRLGGTIKIGRLDGSELPLDGDRLAKYMADTLIQGSAKGKIKFGYSIYSLTEPQAASQAVHKLRRAGMETKRLLKEADLSVRWVRPTVGSALTSVVVEKDGLLKSGGEFVVLVKNGQMRLGLTEAVQPFELFSQVDYGRPKRDTYRGMLPPKLARIMLNIAGVQPESTVWDAFCGSGTVVTEALRLGVKKIYGSDLSEAAVLDTEKNIAWLEEKGLVPKSFNTTIFQHDACEAASNIEDGSINAVVSEPFLGKPQRGGEKKEELLQRLNDLTGLYRAALTALKPKLAANSTVVLALPLYIVDADRIGIDVNQIMGDDYDVEPLILTKRSPSVTYGRPDQKVWREIIKIKPR